MYHVTVWLQSVRTPKCIQVKSEKKYVRKLQNDRRMILHPNYRCLYIVDVYNQTQNKTKRAHKSTYLDVGYIVYSLIMMPRSKGGHPPVYWYLTFGLLVSLRNTNKYRRWGVIKFELFYFGNSLLSHCILCPYLNQVDLRLIYLPFSSALRSVF